MRGVDRLSYRRLALPRFLFVVAALFLALPLLVTGNVFVGSLVAVRMSLASFDAGVVGAILALYSLGFVIGSRYAVRIIFRVGHIRAFAAFSAITCSQALAYPLVETASAWAAWRFVGGAAVAGMTAAIESWISARATPETRGRLLSSYFFVYHFAAAAGQMLIGLTDVSGFAPFSYAAMLIALSAVPLALGRSEAPVPHAVEHLGSRALYRRVPLGAVGSLFAGVLVGGFMMVGPFYAWEAGLDAKQVATFMTSAVLAAVACQLPVGWLSDRFGRLHVFQATVVVALLAAIAGSWPGAAGGWLAYAAAATFTGAAAVLYPLSLAITHDNVPAEQILPANAAVLFVYGLGACVGPLGAASAIRLLGAPGMFAFLAVAAALLLAYTATRMRWPQVREQDRTDFLAMPQATTAVLTEIDPRADTVAQPAASADEPAPQG